MKKKVAVGLSGGVDSSVAAYLLKKKGYDVIGVTMRTWEEDAGDSESGYAGAHIVEDAGRAAQILGIPYYVVDFRKEFKCHVMDYFVQEYLRGRTPNPCIVCNRYVKWEALLQKSQALGADFIATGHYAGVERLPNGRFALRHCRTAKDQTYALYALSQTQLAHTLMPLGDYIAQAGDWSETAPSAKEGSRADKSPKEAIRALAEEAGLPAARKPDSQEICFIPDDDYAGFIERAAGEALPGPGCFVDIHGKALGRHKGVIHYTIGQRRGLELAMGERVYVTDIRPDTNEVVIGRNEDLFTDEVFCEDMHFMAVEDLKEPMRVFAKIRYNHSGEYCRIEKQQDGRVRALFERPVRAAAPGQSICFYDGVYVLGGGVITGGERRSKDGCGS